MTGAWILAGPTASGKTAVANELAVRTGQMILSADSMLVYRDMNIGTAKPTRQELNGIVFRGADLTTPDKPFSTGLWLDAARNAFKEANAAGTGVIVVGGTGLYISALLNGLDAPPPIDKKIRISLEQEFKTGGIKKLWEIAESLSPGSTALVDDPKNPRRLIRLIEKIKAGAPPKNKSPKRSPQIIAALEISPEALCLKIRTRTEQMFNSGLIEETQSLLEKYPNLSRTAAAGIGYSEAAGVLRGEITREQAVEQTVSRTLHLAKRQRTWLRTQLNTCFADAPKNDADVRRAADDVQKIWNKYGPAKPVL